MNPTNQNPLKGRIKQVDGLRGYAVLLVVAFHYLNNQLEKTAGVRPLNAIEKILFKATSIGWCGVDLFFVLSGFLIGSILLENRKSASFFKTFYIRRFLRIIPIYYVLLIIFMLLQHTSFYRTDAYMFEYPVPIGYYFVYFQNFYMSSVANFGPQALTPTWSLAIEEQFYLIIPVIIYFLSNKQLRYFVVFCLVVAWASRYYSPNFYAKYTLLPSRIDSPIIGLLIALLFQGNKFQHFFESKQFQNYTAIFAVLALGVYTTVNVGIFNHTILAVMFGMILIATIYAKNGLFYRILTQKSILYVGKVSFFVYLFHQPINQLLQLAFLNNKYPMLATTKDIVVTIISFGATLALAEISFRFFEAPLIKYSHRFKY